MIVLIEEQRTGKHVSYAYIYLIHPIWSNADLLGQVILSPVLPPYQFVEGTNSQTAKPKLAAKKTTLSR